MDWLTADTDALATDRPSQSERRHGNKNGPVDGARRPGRPSDRIDDRLASYLRSIARIPVLDAEESSRLLRELRRLRRLAEKSASVRNLEAFQHVKNQVILHHLRLVVSYAFRWRHCNVPLLDLVQEGNLGLMRAADRFDPDRGVRFSTYAFWWIRRNILRAIESQGRTIRLPSPACALLSRRKWAEEQLRARLDQTPGIEEVAAALRVSPEVLERLERVGEACVSLDRVSQATGFAFGETIADPEAPSPDAPVVTRWARRVLARVLSCIDVRARRILTLRWGLGGAPPMTCAEVGRRVGLSGGRVRQIEEAAFDRLRRRPDLEKLLGALD
jgi:RNA polymerase primary sigma factor